jgi:hypothetical protein
MVGYRLARGLYTLLTDPDLVGHNLLGNLCKGVPMQSHLRSVIWCLANTAWLGPKFFGAFTLLVGKDVQPLQSVKLID